MLFNKNYQIPKTVTPQKSKHSWKKFNIFYFFSSFDYFFALDNFVILYSNWYKKDTRLYLDFSTVPVYAMYGMIFVYGSIRYGSNH